MTREGLQAFALHGLRLGNLILAGRLASRHIPWRWLGRRESIYIRGFVLALPLMPTLFPRSLALGREILRDFPAGRREGLLAKPLRAWRLEMSDGAHEAAMPASMPGTAGMAAHPLPKGRGRIGIPGRTRHTSVHRPHR